MGHHPTETELLTAQPDDQQNVDMDFQSDDQNKLFVSMLIMLIFSEALAL